MKRHLPSLNALRAFEAAARLGRMSAAADELAVTHGAISRQVRHLEGILGVELFAGSKTKPVLTDAGRTLLPGLSTAFDQMEASVRATVAAEDAILDVSCLSTFLMRWLIPRLHRFNTQNPGIDVRLRAADRAVDLDRERFDVIITVEDKIGTAAPPGQPPPVAASILELFPERLGPVLAPALARPLSLAAPSDLLALPLLHTKTRTNAWAMWSVAAGLAEPDRTLPAIQFEHYYYTIEAAVAGLGVCVAPWHLVADEVRDGRLLAPFGFRPSGYRYVVKRRQRRSGKIDRFCAWLVDEAASMADSPVKGGDPKY